jgi:hypothetical protein
MLTGRALPLVDRQTAMSMTQDPGSLTTERGTLAAQSSEPAPEIDLAERRKIYRWFVRGTFLFAAHALAVLLVLGYVFSDGFG